MEFHDKRSKKILGIISFVERLTSVDRASAVDLNSGLTELEMWSNLINGTLIRDRLS